MEFPTLKQFMEGYVSQLPVGCPRVLLTTNQRGQGIWRSMGALRSAAAQAGELPDTSSSQFDWNKVSLVSPATVRTLDSFDNIYLWDIGENLSMDSWFSVQPRSLSGSAVVFNRGISFGYKELNIPKSSPSIVSNWDTWTERVFRSWKEQRTDKLALGDCFNKSDLELLNHLRKRTIRGQRIDTLFKFIQALAELDIFLISQRQESSAILYPMLGYYRKLSHEHPCDIAFAFDFEWPWVLGTRGANYLNVYIEATSLEIMYTLLARREWPDLDTVIGILNRTPSTGPLQMDEEFALEVALKNGQTVQATISQLRDMVINHDEQLDPEFVWRFCDRYSTPQMCKSCGKHRNRQAMSTSTGYVPSCGSCACSAALPMAPSVSSVPAVSDHANQDIARLGAAVDRLTQQLGANPSPDRVAQVEANVHQLTLQVVELSRKLPGTVVDAGLGLSAPVLITQLSIVTSKLAALETRLHEIESLRAQPSPAAIQSENDLNTIRRELQHLKSSFDNMAHNPVIDVMKDLIQALSDRSDEETNAVVVAEAIKAATKPLIDGMNQRDEILRQMLQIRQIPSAALVPVNPESHDKLLQNLTNIVSQMDANRNDWIQAQQLNMRSLTEIQNRLLAPKSDDEKADEALRKSQWMEVVNGLAQNREQTAQLNTAMQQTANLVGMLTARIEGSLTHTNNALTHSVVALNNQQMQLAQQQHETNNRTLIAYEILARQVYLAQKYTLRLEDRMDIDRVGNNDMVQTSAFLNEIQQTLKQIGDNPAIQRLQDLANKLLTTGTTEISTVTIAEVENELSVVLSAEADERKRQEMTREFIVRIRPDLEASSGLEQLAGAISSTVFGLITQGSAVEMKTIIDALSQIPEQSDVQTVQQRLSNVVKILRDNAFSIGQEGRLIAPEVHQQLVAVAEVPHNQAAPMAVETAVVLHQAGLSPDPADIYKSIVRASEVALYAPQKAFDAFLTDLSSPQSILSSDSVYRQIFSRLQELETNSRTAATNALVAKLQSFQWNNEQPLNATSLIQVLNNSTSSELGLPTPMDVSPEFEAKLANAVKLDLSVQAVFSQLIDWAEQNPEQVELWFDEGNSAWVNIDATRKTIFGLSRPLLRQSDIKAAAQSILDVIRQTQSNNVVPPQTEADKDRLALVQGNVATLLTTLSEVLATDFPTQLVQDINSADNRDQSASLLRNWLTTVIGESAVRPTSSQEVALLQQRVAQARPEIKQTAEANVVLQAQVDSLTSELASCQAGSTNVAQARNQLQEKFDAIIAERDAVLQEMSRLQTEHGDLTVQLAALKAASAEKDTSVQQQMDASQAEYVGLRQQLEAVQNANANLQLQVRTLTEKLQELQERSTGLEQERAALQQQLETTDALRKDLETKYAENKQTYDSQAAELNALRQSASVQFSGLQSELAEAIRARDSLRSENSTISEQLRVLTREKTSLTEQIATVQNSLNVTIRDRDMVVKQLTQTSEDLIKTKATVVERKTMLDELVQRVSMLETKLQVSDQSLESLSAEKQQLDSHIRQLQSEKDMVTNQLQELQSRYDAQSQEYQALKSQQQVLQKALPSQVESPLSFFSVVPSNPTNVKKRKVKEADSSAAINLEDIDLPLEESQQ